MHAPHISIKRVYDKNTNADVDVSAFTVQQTIAPSSKTKVPVWRYFYKGELVKKHNSFMVVYSCPSCKRDNIVCLNNITRKLNRGIQSCNTCRNENAEKRDAHVAFMNINAGKIVKGAYIHQEQSSPTARDMKATKVEHDDRLFESMDDDFKHAYHRRHMTASEFERIRKHIISFQNDKFQLSDDFVYVPHISVPNQTKFNPYMYDKKRDVLEKIQYIKYECEGCSQTFVNRDLYVQKNRYKLLCPECTFCNNAFKIRHTKNVAGTNITYKSKYELKFINYCNEHGIIIENGPKVKYVLQDENERTYRIDFYIPHLSTLVELKDHRVWQKRDLCSRKWNAKESAAREYASKHDMHFVMVFPKNYVAFCRGLLR